MCVLAKSAEWSYEKEWRLIAAPEIIPENEEIGFLVDGIKAKAVYMGCRISEQLKDDLKRLCRKKGIALFQMNIRPGTFELYSEKEQF